jgi:hypothetical protein
MFAWRILIVFNLLAYFHVCNISAAKAQSPFTKNGTIDARGWDFSNRLPLKAEWMFVENKLLNPDGISSREGRPVLFPSLWNDMRSGGRGTGCATYWLTVVVPPGLSNWSFEIPPMNNSYNFWVNGKLIASAGVVGDRAEDSSPQWIYKVGEYFAKTDTLNLVLQISNYHHYKGGASRAIYLGKAEPVRAHFNWAIGSSIAESIILFSSGLLFLFYYYYRLNRKHAVLYFALLCLTWSIRAVFSNVYPLAWMFPGIDWEWSVKTEYISLFLMVVWAALFFHELFSDISNALLTYLAVALNVFFIIFTLLTPAIIYTRWISIYLSVAVFVILYGVTMIVQALIFEKEGSWFLMGSIWIGIVLFAYDIAAYHISFPYNLALMNLGYILIFALTTVGMLYHIGVLKTKNLRGDSMTMQDIYGR